MVLKSKKPHAFISSRDHLIYSILSNPPNSFHLPPETQDSTLIVDTMAMAINKNFPFIKQVNHL